MCPHKDHVSQKHLLNILFSSPKAINLLRFPIPAKTLYTVYKAFRFNAISFQRTDEFSLEPIFSISASAKPPFYPLTSFS